MPTVIAYSLVITEDINHA